MRNNLHQLLIKLLLQLIQLNQLFFSHKNLDLIQDMIRYRVYMKSNQKYIIGKQSNVEVQIVMRSIYLQQSTNLPTNIKEQISYLNNLVADQHTIKFPSYNLPTFNLSTKSYDNWLYDLHETQEYNTELTPLENIPKYFSFRPTSEWDDLDCNIYYNNLNIIADPLKFIYGVFESNDLANNETLFKIKNKSGKC